MNKETRLYLSVTLMMILSVMIFTGIQSGAVVAYAQEAAHPETLDKETLEAFAVIDAKVAEFNTEYGPNYYWPLEAKAELSQLRVELGIDKEPSNGLPTAEDIPFEQALTVAKKTMIEAFGFSEDKVDSMYAGPRFFLTYPKVGHAWQIDFVPDTQEARWNGTDEVYTVVIDATTGEILATYMP